MSEQTTTEIATRPATNGAAERAPAPATAPPQYMSGFDGMATQPFPEAAIKALTAPIDPAMVEVKPDGIVYLPGVFYRQRLTEAFGPGGWSMAPRGPARVMGNVVTYHGALYALGRFVSEAVGENGYHANNENMSYASALEGARTDCITRCCKDLLVAKELWDPGWRAAWLEKWALKAWLMPAQVGPNARKGKWIHWRKDRETPWQVVKAGARPMPAVTSPEPADEEPPAPPVARGAQDPKAEAARSASPAAARPAPADQTSPSPGATDTGEAADESDLEELERLVFKEMKWRKPFAAGWLKKHHGTDDPRSLTKQQLKDTFSLLFAHRHSPDAYKAEVAALQAAGRIRKQEAA